jgi:hypothetical protein
MSLKIVTTFVVSAVTQPEPTWNWNLNHPVLAMGTMASVRVTV